MILQCAYIFVLTAFYKHILVIQLQLANTTNIAVIKSVKSLFAIIYNWKV